LSSLGATHVYNTQIQTRVLSGINLENVPCKDHHWSNQRTVVNTSNGQVYMVKKLVWENILKKYDMQDKGCEESLGRTISLSNHIEDLVVNAYFQTSKSCEEKKIAPWKNEAQSTAFSHTSRNAEFSTVFGESLDLFAESSENHVEKYTRGRQKLVSTHNASLSLTKRPHGSSPYNANNTKTPEVFVMKRADPASPSICSCSRLKSLDENRVDYRVGLQNVPVIQQAERQSASQKTHHPPRTSHISPPRTKSLTETHSTGKTSRQKGKQSLSPTRISSGSAFYTCVVAEQKAKTKRVVSEHSHAKNTILQPLTDFCEMRNIITVALLCIALLFFVILCLILVFT